jgi:hypothetical protein
MTQLEPCPHCNRHVKVSETSCPFCASVLADAFADRAPRVAPRARLGRAAVFAFGVVATTQVACGDNTKVSPSQDAASIPADATPDAALDGGEVPIYAAAPTQNRDGTTSRG